MHGHGWRPGHWVLAASVTAAALASPPRATAAEAIETLPGVTISAVVADLDDDGAREVVRIIEAGANATAIDVWRHTSRGWLRVGSAPLVTPDEIGNSTLADRSLGAGALLVTQRDGRDRVLALTAQGIPDDDYDTCCLALAEVRLDDAHDILLAPLDAVGLDAAAEQVEAIDLDGDGTDELATIAIDTDEGGMPVASRVAALAWDEGAFSSIGQVDGPADWYADWVVGETNGVTGDDLHTGATEFGVLTRIALVGGELVVEEGNADMGQSGGWVAGIADGQIVVSSQSGVHTLRWQAGSGIQETGRSPRLPYPWVVVVGSGPDALLVHQDDAFNGPPSFTVHDLDLRPLGEVEASAQTRDLWEALNRNVSLAGDRYLYPYVGPLPDGSFGGRAAFASSGIAIVQDGEGGFETRGVSDLAGLSPIGVAGPNDGWLAVGDGVAFGPSATAYVVPGQLVSFGAGRLIVGPIESVLTGTDPASAVSIELRGPVVPAPDEVDRLLARPDGFEAVVTAPPGSVVIRAGLQPEEYDVADAPVAVEIRPRARADEDRGFRTAILVFTPEGRASVLDLKGTFVSELPEVDARAETETFALASRIRGVASPGTIVAIDGRQVEAAPDGTFEVVVDAALWPEDVVVIARDALGNETARRLQVLGFVDYRGLPWVPIAGLATLAAGAIVYVRTPRISTRARAAWDGDATLEEIDAD